MKVLAIFAHPDDEMSCIGTLKKHAERGDETMLVWTTHGELASQFIDETEEDVRRIRQEHGAWVADKVGARHHFFDMGDSRMTGSRDEALAVARLYSDFKPDAVITWSDDHPHPDHRTVAKIAFDAVTLARIPKILSEQSPETLEPHRNAVRFFQYPSAAFNRPMLHVDISEHIDTVMEIFEFYQNFYGWQYTPEQFRESRATLGRESGVDYAEKLQRRSAVTPAVDYLV